MKELIRSMLSSPPVAAAVRALTLRSPLPLERRRRIYLAVGRRIRTQPERTFEHREPGGAAVRFHLDGLVRELYWTGAFEADSLPLFVDYARSSRCILDVGAADGEHALLAASVAPDATVVAFEPSPAQFELLSRNVELNRPGPGDRVVAVQLALSDRRGSAPLFEQGGNSSLNPDFRADAVARVVAVERGDDVVPDLAGGRPVDLVKIDTESTEPAVLDGLGRIVAEDRPVVFCEVLPGRTESELQAFVDAAGYDAWWLGPGGPVRSPRIAGRPTYVNWLLLPSGTRPIAGRAAHGAARAR